MENLKEKIFSFGVFGDYITKLTFAEILMALEQPWIEVITYEEMVLLRTTFTTSTLTNYANYILSELTTYKQSSLDRYIIKMNTLAWKEYLTNGHFNFTSKEYYYILDALIRKNEYCSVAELRVALNIESKKMFYIVKKLKNLGYIKKSKEETYSIKINRNEDGTVVKGTKKEKRLSNGGETKIEEKNTKIELLWDTPLVYQLKNLVDNNFGVSSKDVEEKLGIKLKLGLKLLQKVTKNRKDIKIVEEFEGKIKRTKFYSINNRNNKNESTTEGICIQDRINAIEQMLLKRPYFILSKEARLEFDAILNTTYTTDKRTLLKAAQKGNFKIIALPTHSKNRYAICRKDVNDIIINLKQDIIEEEKLNEFQKTVYRLFVISPKLIEKDNGYEYNRDERNKLFYNYLLNKKEKEINIIEKINNEESNKYFNIFEEQDKEYLFDCDDIYSMSLKIFLALIPIKKKGFKKEILRILKSHSTNINDNYIENNYINYPFKPDVNNLEDSSEVEENLLETKMENIITIEKSITKYLNSRVQVKYFNEYFFNEYFKGVKIEEGKIKYYFNKEIKSENKDILKVEHIDLESRESFFNRIKNIPKNYFYTEVSKIISTEYEHYEDILMRRLKLLKKEKDNTQEENTFKEKYYAIKEYIIKNERLDIKKIDKVIFTLNELEIILNCLLNRKIISNYKRNTREYSRITSSENFKRKVNYSEKVRGHTGVGDNYNGYFSIFYSLVYYILLKNGTLSFSSLLAKVEVMEDFELDDFLVEYKNMVNIKTINNEKFISLNISENILDDFI